jgi:tRNA-dihydrouridine synthase B
MHDSFEFCGLQLPNNIFLAPMAGITTRPFRAIALSLGAGLAWTEMISAEGLVRNDVKTRSFLPDGDEGGAVAVQIFGHRPETLRDAAVIAGETPASIIDINMGCPVRKIVSNGSGAALMKDPMRAGKIIAAVCEAVKKPVTVKIRSGWDKDSLNAAGFAAMARQSGAAAVTVHGRTARQGFGGRSDWTIVHDVSRTAGLPVVGSGDLTTPAEVERALDESHCAAVMIGRAALGRPWIFRDILLHRAGRGGGEEGRAFVAALMERHLELNLEEFGPYRGVILMRRPLAWYSRGMAGAAEFRKRINTISEEEMMREQIHAFAAGRIPPGAAV